MFDWANTQHWKFFEVSINMHNDTDYCTLRAYSLKIKLSQMMIEIGRWGSVRVVHEMNLGETKSKINNYIYPCL